MSAFLQAGEIQKLQEEQQKIKTLIEDIEKKKKYKNADEKA